MSVYYQISIDDWLNLFNDENVFKPENMLIMRRFMDMGGAATCSQLAKRYGQTWAYYNSMCSKLAKRIADKMQLSLEKRDDGSEIRWPVLFTGSNVASDENIDGSFLWTLKPNLKAALEKVDLSQFEPLYETDADLIQNIDELKKNIERYEYLKSLPNFDVEQLKKVLRGSDNFVRYEWKDQIYFANAKIIGYHLYDDVFARRRENGDGRVVIQNLNRFLGRRIENDYVGELKNFWNRENIGPWTEKTRHFWNVAFKEENKSMDEVNKYCDFLKANHNIILHGAPGTGKTYLAKKIAKALSAEYEMVQFHQSYDYTDFVEGLRPVEDEDGNMGFERQDGVFKSFCKEALGENEKHYSNFEEAYKNLVDDASKEGLKLSTLARGKVFKVIVNGKGNLCAVPNTEAQSEMTITKEALQTAIVTGEIRDWKPYVTAIEVYLREKYGLGDVQEDDSSKNKKYIFIIDEINRGEMSKIFGELFFSIDPGYRGEAGRIKTQYQNLVPEGDAFEKGFFVPENVYIIGTMNDIDRSVESMDFAMRRRFAFKEVTAKDRKDMLYDKDCGLGDLASEAENRMIALNKTIWDDKTNKGIVGLSSAYHIGPAYFLKLKNYKENEKPFDDLWENHLKGVLQEYLRGMPKATTLLDELKSAYDNAVKSSDSVDNPANTIASNESTPVA